MKRKTKTIPARGAVSLPLVGPETVAHKSIFKERRPAYPIPIPQAHSSMRKCSRVTCLPGKPEGRSESGFSPPVWNATVPDPSQFWRSRIEPNPTRPSMLIRPRRPRNIVTDRRGGQRDQRHRVFGRSAKDGRVSDGQGNPVYSSQWIRAKNRRGPGNSPLHLAKTSTANSRSPERRRHFISMTRISSTHTRSPTSTSKVSCTT